MCDVNNCKTLSLAVKRLDPAAVLPRYATPGAAGADLCALPVGDPVIVRPGETVFVRTGLAMAIPAGTVGLIYARSGMACKQDLALSVGHYSIEEFVSIADCDCDDSVCTRS